MYLFLSSSSTPLSPALVHPSCNMHLSPPTTLVFLAFCSPCQPFCSNFPSPPRSFTSPISLSPDSFSSFISFASDFVPHKLPSSSSFNPAPPSFSIPLLLHLCCLSSCSPTQITHLCHTDFLLRERVCVRAIGRSSRNSQSASAQKPLRLLSPAQLQRL